VLLLGSSIQAKALNINPPRKQFLYVGSALNYISTMRLLMWLFTSLGCIVGESPAVAKPAYRQVELVERSGIEARGWIHAMKCASHKNTEVVLHACLGK
jgi:hypothetical protein